MELFKFYRHKFEKVRYKILNFAVNKHSQNLTLYKYTVNFFLKETLVPTLSSISEDLLGILITLFYLAFL